MRALALALALALLAPAAAQPAAPTLTVYAAADLTSAFREIVPLFEKASGSTVTLVLGSTGNLARQIEHGAPADVLFAANEAFLDDLRAKGAVIPETRLAYAQGRLALVTSRASRLALRDLKDLARPEVRRIAIANPAHAPYGRAAQEALESAGLWDRLRPRLVYGENIRHTLQFVETGAAEAGVVALALAHGPGIQSVPVDPALHKPLNQVAAVVTRSPRPELALAFLHFVTGPEGWPIMKRYGFLLPGEVQ